VGEELIAARESLLSTRAAGEHARMALRALRGVVGAWREAGKVVGEVVGGVREAVLA